MGHFDGHEAPTSLGSIYGYRYWYLVEGRLVSVSTHGADGKGIPWVDGENVAYCAYAPNEYKLGLPRRPSEPDRPEILATESASGGNSHFFGEYVRRAQVKEGGGFSFPVMEDGSVVMPRYSETPEYRERLRKAKEYYESEMVAYRAQLLAWEQAREEALARFHEDHPVPVLGCTCGFYMVKEPNHAKTYTSARRDVPLGFGVVEGYGKVVVGERGWRFEKARIRGLVMTPEKIRDCLDLKLGEKNRVELMPRTIEAWNDFDEFYASVYKYDSAKEMRAEWDERVENS